MEAVLSESISSESNSNSNSDDDKETTTSLSNPAETTTMNESEFESESPSPSEADSDAEHDDVNDMHQQGMRKQSSSLEQDDNADEVGNGEEQEKEAEQDEDEEEEENQNESDSEAEFNPSESITNKFSSTSKTGLLSDTASRNSYSSAETSHYNRKTNRSRMSAASLSSSFSTVLPSSIPEGWTEEDWLAATSESVSGMFKISSFFF